MPPPNTLHLQQRSHKTAVVLVLFAIAVVVVVVAVLAMRWPFTRQAMIKSLQDASSSTVEITHFHGTYFPFPGCIAEGVIFRGSSDPNTPPLITVGKLTIQSSFLGVVMRHVTHIQAEKLHIIISSFGTAQKSTNPSNSTIDEIVANGAILEFTRSPGKLPLIFKIHESTLRNVGAFRSLSFQVKLSNPRPPGEIIASGRFGPWKAGDAGQTPVLGDYTFQNADLGIFNGIAGMLSSHGKFQGTLEHIGVEGSTETPDFEVTSSGHQFNLKPSSMPS
jgi:hypothetical protein